VKKNETGSTGNCDYCKFYSGRLAEYKELKVCPACEDKLLKMELEQCEQLEMFGKL